jgi:hypothetical protein
MEKFTPGKSPAQFYLNNAWQDNPRLMPQWSNASQLVPYFRIVPPLIQGYIWHLHVQQ